MRRAHPGWGPRTIGYHLEREGVEPAPSRSAIYRALVRHKLIDPQQRRKRRSDYKRWERALSMELWQMDVMGGVFLVDGTGLRVVTGITTTPGSVCLRRWCGGPRPGRCVRRVGDLLQQRAPASGDRHGATDPTVRTRRPRALRGGGQQDPPPAPDPVEIVADEPRRVTRKVGQTGRISLADFRYVGGDLRAS